MQKQTKQQMEVLEQERLPQKRLIAKKSNKNAGLMNESTERVEFG